MPEMNVDGTENVAVAKESTENTNEQAVGENKDANANEQKKKAMTFLICHADQYLDLESIALYGKKLQELNQASPEITHLFVYPTKDNGEIDKTQVIGLKVEDREGKPTVAFVSQKEMKDMGITTESNFNLLVRTAKDNTKDAVAKMYNRTTDATGKVILVYKEGSAYMLESAMRGLEKASLIAAYKRDAMKEFVRDTIKKGQEMTDDIKKGFQKKAEDKYNELASRYDEFDKKKDSTFDKLTKDLIQAKVRLQEKIMSKFRPFVRAKEAFEAAIKAGRETWANSAGKEVNKALSLKPAKETVKANAITNER